MQYLETAASVHAIRGALLHRMTTETKNTSGCLTNIGYHRTDPAHTSNLLPHSRRIPRAIAGDSVTVALLRIIVDCVIFAVSTLQCADDTVRETRNRNRNAPAKMPNGCALRMCIEAYATKSYGHLLEKRREDYAVQPLYTLWI